VIHSLIWRENNVLVLDSTSIESDALGTPVILHRRVSHCELEASYMAIAITLLPVASFSLPAHAGNIAAHLENALTL
jgi:hypothetical protein